MPKKTKPKRSKIERVAEAVVPKRPKAVERLAAAVAVATGAEEPKPIRATTGKTRYTNTRPRRSASWTLEEWREHLTKKPPPPESKRWGTTEWLAWCHRTGYPIDDGSDTAPWSARVLPGAARDDDGPAFGRYVAKSSAEVMLAYAQRWRGRAAR